MVDIRQRRPACHPRSKGPDRTLLTLENRLHPTILKIANPAANSVLAGSPLSFPAKEDSLDPPGYPNMGPNFVLGHRGEAYPSIWGSGEVPSGQMNVQIWVSAWELECCQPDATVGEPWVASVVGLRPPEPWWAKHAPDPIPRETLNLGVTDLEGRAASRTLHTESTIVDVGGGRVVVPGWTGEGPVKVHGRLWLDAHEYPEYRGVDGLVWSGIVQRIRGIRLVFRPVTVYLAIPIRQEEPVEMSSTSGRDDPVASDRGFTEFLIDLKTGPTG